jgi:hypothetical protein
MKEACSCTDDDCGKNRGFTLGNKWFCMKEKTKQIKTNTDPNVLLCETCGLEPYLCDAFGCGGQGSAPTPIKGKELSKVKIHNTLIRLGQGNKPMKTKLDVLKGIMVVDPNTKEVLRHTINALENPLGVLPGEEVEVWDGFGEIPKRATFIHFDGSRYICCEFTGEEAEFWNYARVPLITQDVTFHNVDVRMLEQQRKDLDFVLARQPDGVAKDAILGIREMLDAWADERDKS